MNVYAATSATSATYQHKTHPLGLKLGIFPHVHRPHSRGEEIGLARHDIHQDDRFAQSQLAPHALNVIP